jgi:uncharacterized protein (DUF1501 family)
MDRRFFLRGAAMLGCSAAAHPWLTTVTLAGATDNELGDNRLVVVILRGAMDGLDVLRPMGDPDFAAYRPTLLDGGGSDLDGFFALHPSLAKLMPLWAAGELGFVHATSTPYRDKRSHFDGQDMLEAGTGMDVPLSTVRDGWLNRMLGTVPGLRAQTAFAVGQEAIPLLEGPTPVMSWAPEQKLELSAQSRLLLQNIYHDDPLFRMAATDAMELSDMLGEASMSEGMAPVRERQGDSFADIDRLVDFAAARLADDTRIATFSLSGWDTHRAQRDTIARPLSRLERVILRMKGQMGAEVWGKTLVLCMTEFGRTVRENGTSGTDHGTAGAMVMAGGALKGGKVYGRWPGLEEAALYDRRDLMPTSDVRNWAAWAMRGMYGLDQGLLQDTVFPGLIMDPDPGFLQ